MEHARDQGRGVVQKPEMGFYVVIVGWGRWGGGPEERVIIGEEGEYEPEEEGCRWRCRVRNLCRCRPGEGVTYGRQ